MVKVYNMIKAEIASFEKEFENEFNLDFNKMNSKYALVKDKITPIINQLEEFLTFHGIELTKNKIPTKINLIEMVSGMLNKLALEIPQMSKEKARQMSNAKCQAKRRENETGEQKQARRDKEAKAQALKRSLETEDEREARLKADRDSHWQKREEQFEVVGDYALRLKAANKGRPHWRKLSSVPYQNEAEEKAVEKYLDCKEADTKRRRALKDAMSKDELQSYLDKNAKWHRDRRVTETKQRMKKWVDYYEMMAQKADSNERRLRYLADAEREKLKYQSLRAPDSRALLSQESSAM